MKLNNIVMMSLKLLDKGERGGKAQSPWAELYKAGIR